MSKEITLSNIKNFATGNARMALDQLGLLTDNHIKEQVTYRISLCKDDCLVEGKCKHCGCKVPGRLYSTPSCNNGERFPDLMDEKDWIKYKERNDIK